MNLVLTLLVAAGLIQTHPDFSGTWRMDESRSESPTYVEFVGPMTVTLKHTAAGLVIDTRRGDKSETIIYRMDPSDVALAGGSGIPGSRAYWDGSTLITETVRTINGQTVRTKETRRLGPAGEMQIETLLIVEHGYTLQRGKNYNAARDVFVKTVR